MDRCDSARLDARRLMTPDSFSDLALFLVCLGILHRCWWVQTDRAAIGLAGLLIGFAAALGVLRFSTWTEIGDLVKGVHQFASVLAAVAGFPMLALGIVRPDSTVARYRAGAWWCAFVIGGFGVAVWVLGFKPWAQLVPAVSALAMLVALRKPEVGRNRALRALGVGFLFVGFTAVVLLTPTDLLFGLVTRVQLLHYALVVGLPLIVLGAPRVNS